MEFHRAQNAQGVGAKRAQSMGFREGISKFDFRKRGYWACPAFLEAGLYCALFKNSVFLEFPAKGIL